MSSGEVVIIGCGYLGREIARRCRLAQMNVTAVTRASVVDVSGVDVLHLDVLDVGQLEDLPRDVRAVVYAVSAGERTDEAYEAAYVHGLRNILSFYRAGAEPPRVLFISSTGVYHQNGGEWVDEDTPIRPADFGGQRLLEGESLLATYPGQSSALRFGGIYGPGRTRMIQEAARVDALTESDFASFTNRIHRDDGARFVTHLMRQSTLAARYNVVDSAPASRGTVIEALRARMGLEAPRRIDEVENRSPSGKRCSNARMLSTGFVLEYPTFAEGYGSLLPTKP